MGSAFQKQPMHKHVHVSYCSFLALGLVSAMKSSWENDLSVYMVAGNNVHNGSYGHVPTHLAFDSTKGVETQEFLYRL